MATSSTRWYNRAPNATSAMNNTLVLDRAQLTNLALYSTAHPIDGLILGDYTDWLTSLRFYPYRVSADDATEYWLKIFSTTLDSSIAGDGVTCQLLPASALYGYIIGQIGFMEGGDSAYWKIEPYTRMQVYLPFYGFAEIKPSDVDKKWLQIVLYVDYNTGQAQYTLMVTDSHIEYNEQPYAIPAGGINDFLAARIIGTYPFTMGQDIPISSTNASENVRNVLMTGTQVAVSLAAGVYLPPVATQTTTTTHQTTQTARNPATGRQVKMGGETVTTTEESTRTAGSSPAPAAARVASTVLDAFHMSPVVGSVGNSVINSTGCRSARIITRRSTLAIDPTDENYRALYGLPLSQVRSLNNVYGYTELSHFHLEGTPFRYATVSERAMLERELMSGIILPDPPSE